MMLSPFAAGAFRGAWLRQSVETPSWAALRVVGFAIKVQQQCFADWCWAAAAVSVRRHFKTPDSQCECVERVRAHLQAGTCCGYLCNGVDHPVPECAGRATGPELEVALGPHLGPKPQSPVSLDEIAADVDRGRPVVLGLHGRDHLVVVFEVIGEGDDAIVRYRDPLTSQATDPRIERAWEWLRPEVAAVFRTQP